jgi:hypothetical protein
MPTLGTLRTQIDTFLSNNLATFSARQENFRANRGRYWQALKTHTTPPSYTNASGSGAVPDNIDSNPVDAFESWRAAFPQWADVELPCQFRVETYDGPSGMGWVVIIAVIHNGTEYRRAINVGPEPDRDRAWHAIVPPPV